MNGSVQITAAGTPCFSNCIPSCTLHDEHDPQSPEAVITRSQLSATFERMSSGQGREAFPLFSSMPSLTSLFSLSTSYTCFSNSTEFRLPFANSPIGSH